MKLSYWGIDTEHPDWFLKIDDGEELTVEGCGRLLELVESRKRMLDPSDNDAQQQFDALVQLLAGAIKMESPIIWSV